MKITCYEICLALVILCAIAILVCHNYAFKLKVKELEVAAQKNQAKKSKK